MLRCEPTWWAPSTPFCTASSFGPVTESPRAAFPTVHTHLSLHHHVRRQEIRAPLLARHPYASSLYSLCNSDSPYPAGRGEFVRLAFEATKTPYIDVSNTVKDGIHQILALKADDATHDADGNPPAFAPPALRIHGEGKNGKSLVISQTPAILAYLGEKLHLSGTDAAERAWIHALALTALDLNNETHDTHHPVSTQAYYEDQKPEALKKATDFRDARIPKFLGYFERVLKGNNEGAGKYLVGDKLR